MGFTLPKYKIDQTLLSILIVFLVCLVLSEPFRLSLPFIDNTRKLILPISIMILVMSLVDYPSRVRVLDLIRSRLGFLLILWVISLCISLVFSYGINSLNYLTYHLLSVISFLSAYALSLRHKHPSKFISNTTSIVTFFVLSVSIFSMVRYLFPGQLETIPEYVYTIKSAKYMEYDQLRSRIFPAGNIDYTLAFVASSILSVSSYLQVVVILSVFTALLLSNYRGRILIGLISFMLVIFVNRSRSIRLIFLTLFITASLGVFLNETSFLTRYTFQNSKDVDTIVDRLNYSGKAMSLFLDNPLVGVGLGNYPIYSNTVRLYSASGDQNNSVSINSFENPHNFIVTMLAETGVLGTLTFLLIVSIFIYVDLYLYKNIHQTFIQISPFIISSWCLIVGSLIDWYDPHHLVYFMLIRGYIYGIYKRQVKT